MDRVVCAVDVGTRSARAGLFSASGVLLGRAEHPILLHQPCYPHAEHESEDIWRAVCAAVRAARAQAGVDSEAVVGIAFDATCSLVVLDREGHPLSVSATGEAGHDTVVWLDHRALAEADECSATGDRVLDFSGGTISPEMAIAKLMWLKRHLPHVWARTGYLFDLADFLSWKASGSLARSQCTLTCKWTYLAHEAGGWQRGFLARIGLDDLIERGSLPESASPVGASLGPLTEAAATDLGLTRNCSVAVGLIDAFAGALGVLGPHALTDRSNGHMALIAGTSSCVMSMSAEAKSVRGYWGPYFGVALPGFWVTEGGQSATGALLDHVVRVHGAGGEPTPQRHRAILERIAVLRAEQGEAFACRLNVLPDFLGNRSPLADPAALGVISGLSLDPSFDALCALYWRTCVAIAMGVRQIIEGFEASGAPVRTLHVTGGHTRNRLLMQLYADTTGCTIIEPQVDEGVLLGTAMAAACGAGVFADLPAACLAMQRDTRTLEPDPAAVPHRARDYRIFLEMQRQRQVLEAMA